MVTAHGYSYVYHLRFTDIFFVRSDLLPAEFRGMRLEETFDAFPLHRVDLSIAEMSAKGLSEQEQSDCEGAKGKDQKKEKVSQNTANEKKEERKENSELEEKKKSGSSEQSVVKEINNK